MHQVTRTVGAVQHSHIIVVIILVIIITAVVILTVVGKVDNVVVLALLSCLQACRHQLRLSRVRASCSWSQRRLAWSLLQPHKMPTCRPADTSQQCAAAHMGRLALLHQAWLLPYAS